jgi:hypothetical protein
MMSLSDCTTEQLTAARWIGENNPKARLTNEQVNLFGELITRVWGVYAERFGVARGTILRVPRDRTWRQQQ